MRSCAWAAAAALVAGTAGAGRAGFVFSTGDPDGKMATTSRAGTAVETESADDFVLAGRTRITSATFTGLIVGTPGATPTVDGLVVAIYQVFPKNSDAGRPPTVPTRTNSPADTELDARESALGGLTFTQTVLAASFTAANSVLDGINPSPNQFTGGEGPVTGQEVRFDVTFTTPFDLPADHYFFVPQVAVTGGEFFWLSAAKPIVPPGTPFSPDLQSWVRNGDLDPDWLRVGTDITAQGPFNASFSLQGQAVPAPPGLALGLLGTVGLAGVRRFGRTG
ncbi:MAG: hypothetical protein K2X82_16330 [Gemmataceae bacterium]|nr:hypothetical protein [Gemmataceae bacterium]